MGLCVVIRLLDVAMYLWIKHDRRFHDLFQRKNIVWAPAYSFVIHPFRISVIEPFWINIRRHWIKLFGPCPINYLTSSLPDNEGINTFQSSGPPTFSLVKLSWCLSLWDPLQDNSFYELSYSKKDQVERVFNFLVLAFSVGKQYKISFFPPSHSLQ